MKVLLSIKPEYVDKIFSGEKLYEFRKSIFKDPKVDTVLVYATKPVGKVVGEFTIANVHSGSPEYIWSKTEKKSGISLKFFQEYFSGREKAYAIEVCQPKKFDIPLGVKEFIGRNVPPQSFAYVKG